MLTLALFGLPILSSAQTYPLFTTSEDIDIANIKAPHSVHGDILTATSGRFCEFPKGSGKNIATISTLWMGAYDATSALKCAAKMYRADASDYWPGPADTLSISDAQRYAMRQSWARIWKVNSSEIDAFLLLSTHTVANTPAPILEWPAKGNSHAKGAGGAVLNITEDMAPFVDVNTDGVYDPLAGDYPKMKGSQMLWWIINDANNPHPVSSTNEMKMEIKMSAFAYKMGTVADNIIFYEYEITNKSASIYSAYRMGIMADFDLGQAFDDYTGFDSTHRMGIVYNGSPIMSPITGMAMLEQPGDVYGIYTPLGSYAPFQNGISAVGDPQNGVEFYRLMNSQTRTGIPITSGSKGERMECDSMVTPGDRRFVIASRDYSFSPGQTRKFGAAMIAADSAGGCPNINFSQLHQAADTAFKLYWNSFRVTPPGTSNGIAAIQRSSLRMFPNPATSRLYVETAGQSKGILNIYDALGRSVTLPQTPTAKGFELNTSILPTGVYSIRHQSGTTIETGIFVKE